MPHRGQKVDPVLPVPSKTGMQEKICQGGTETERNNAIALQMLLTSSSDTRSKCVPKLIVKTYFEAA